MSTKPIDYQALTSELEQILSTLQTADLDVDKTVTAYERGMTIAKQLDDYLSQAENKVAKVKASWAVKEGV